MAVQALLDRENLSCNCIDGVLGSRTRAAIRAWQGRNGLPATGEIDADLLSRLGLLAPDGAEALGRAFTTYAVAPEDAEGLAPVPKTWSGRARAERLGYETTLEVIAERFHAAQHALRELNPDAPWPSPPPGTVLVVPDPRPFATPPAARLTISLGRKLVRAYDAGGALIAQFPCSIAQLEEKRPVGELRVVNCAENPEYYFDPAVFPEDPEAATIQGKLIIPPGPNNPVGVAWITLSKEGYGIHGTPHPEDIGKTESHGCFRLANWNAEKLVRMITVGMPVVVEP